MRVSHGIKLWARGPQDASDLTEGRESKQLTDTTATATTSHKNSRTFPLAKCDFEQVAHLNLSFIICKIWIIAACRMVLRVKRDIWEVFSIVPKTKTSVTRFYLYIVLITHVNFTIGGVLPLCLFARSCMTPLQPHGP